MTTCRMIESQRFGKWLKVFRNRCFHHTSLKSTCPELPLCVVAAKALRVREGAREPFYRNRTIDDVVMRVHMRLIDAAE